MGHKPPWPLAHHVQFSATVKRESASRPQPTHCASTALAALAVGRKARHECILPTAESEDEHRHGTERCHPEADAIHPLPLLPGSFYRFRLRLLTTLIAVVAIPASNVGTASFGCSCADDRQRRRRQCRPPRRTNAATSMVVRLTCGKTLLPEGHRNIMPRTANFDNPWLAGRVNRTWPKHKQVR